MLNHDVFSITVKKLSRYFLLTSIPGRLKSPCDFDAVNGAQVVLHMLLGLLRIGKWVAIEECTVVAMSTCQT